MNTHSSRGMQWGVTGLMAVLFALSLGWFMYANYQAEMRSWNLVLSGILLAVPIALLFFSLGIFFLAWQEKRSEGQISQGLAKLIYYTPRIAGVLIILFVGLFSLDVFGQGYSFWETVGAFLMHNLATIVMAVVLALAWRRPAVGFWAFLLVAIFFLRFVLGSGFQALGNVLLFSGPMAATALLFWVNWKWRKEMQVPVP